VALGLGVPAEEPVKPREPAVGVALAERVARRSPELERHAARLDRLLDLVGEVALV
jgi:hypothetical protein